MSKNIKENKMGTMGINKLLITTSAPLMLSMLIQALYNIVDSIFVARYDETKNALTAVSLAFPAQNLIIAVAVGTGVGVSALVSRKLGQKDTSGVRRTASNGLFLALCSFAVFLVLGLTCVRPFFEIQTSNENIVKLGYQYLTICMCGSFAVFVQIMFERFMQSTGKTVCVLFSHGIGAIVNIVFDPIFIFTMDMGIIGAALATILGQFCGMLFAMLAHFKFNREVPLQIKGFMPDKETVKEIYKIGIPSIIMQSIGSVMTFGMNQILMTFGEILGEIAVGVFGIYFKLQSFVFMPIFGLNNGMVPIIGYNYGARKRERIVKVIKYAVIYAIAIMALGTLIFMIFPAQLLDVFKATGQMREIGISALRIISVMFMFAGVSIVLSSTFQAFGDAVKSMIVSITRQLAVLLPTAFLLSRTGNVHIVWWSLPVAEVFSITLCLIFYIKLYNKTIKKV